MPWVLIVVIVLVVLIVSNTIEIALMGRRVKRLRETVDLVRSDVERLRADVTHDLKQIAKAAVAKPEPPTYRSLWPQSTEAERLSGWHP